MTTSLAATLPERAPRVGELVHVRSRRWLVEEVVAPANPEHRLFLSARRTTAIRTASPHCSSCSTPTASPAGVKVRGQRELDDVIERIEIAGLPDDAPELVLSRLLDEYREAREQRHRDASGRARAAAGLLVVGLQQRLPVVDRGVRA